MASAYVSLIQSDYGLSRHGNFEAAIVHGTELWHWFRDNSRNDFGPWIRGPRITGDHDTVAGAGCIIQSDFGAGPHRNFEVVAPLHLNDGAIELRHFFHDNRDVRLLWIKAQFITQSCAGLGGIIQSSFDSPMHGNFEVVVEECRGAVVHYWHPNLHVEESWIRTDCFDTLQPHPRLANRAQKIVQLTGEFDREGWDGTGTAKFAFNRTESRFGIIGTDLGASFAHQDRLYFLFGDTWRIWHGIPNDDLGSIAFCTDKTADAGLGLTFLSRPPLVPGIAQGGFDVPLDGVSANRRMYVFFSTDARQAGIYSLMGRSILARSDDGLSFTLLYEVSRHKFVNVSTMIVDAAEHGLPGTGPQLVIFGSGRYRSRDVYLAVKPVAKIAEPGGFLFYSGGLGRPQWSAAEDDAMPLFGEGCVGELSVRWNPLLAPGPVFITPTGRQTDHRSAA